MAEWHFETVDECLSKLHLGSIKKLQTRDYKPIGRFPIIDQGQALIAGWTDDDSGLITKKLPLVVFGDHTRAFKYVDFPFVRGADGTQVLKPKPGIAPLFFYYALRGLELPSRGYNRHFKALKEKEIGIPSETEQTDIARALKAVEDALAIQVREILLLERCKRAAMQALFTKGLRGEAQKETEIGPVPESWTVAPLDAHFFAVSGGTPSRSNPSYWHSGTIPWVKSTEVNYCVIEATEERITLEGLNNSAAKLLLPGTLLLAMYGQGVTRGKVAILGIDATCNQACAAIRTTDQVVDQMYLYHSLTYRYDDIRQLAHGGQQQNLNLDIVRRLPIAFPMNDIEQREIVGVLDTIDRKIDLHREKRAVLDDLFKNLLHDLMTGEIRVADLDLPPFPNPRQTTHGHGINCHEA